MAVMKQILNVNNFAGVSTVTTEFKLACGHVITCDLGTDPHNDLLDASYAARAVECHQCGKEDQEK